ncbi:hypothetical protein BGZ57DRAFT_955986 [Hyaloscypha finlandica]|nr:hypothetical protein BGZ57DRAFT_955986 [Hyaloscypha finlandica]
MTTDSKSMAKIVAGATSMRLLRIYNLSSEASAALVPQTEYFQLAPRTAIPRATIVIQNKPIWLFPGAPIARIIPKMRKKVAKTMPVWRPRADEETTRAALIHDVGQFLPIDEAKDAQMGIKTHPVRWVGYRVIGENVVRLVGCCVATRRYSTAFYTRYYNGLSETSKQSLKFQGGLSKGEELETFERNPMRVEMVELTSLDDWAKTMGIAWQTPRT